MRASRLVARLVPLAVLAGGAAIPCPAAVAGDFRIETKIFAGEEPEPVSENVTLFHRGVVYDFLAGPAQISVFRKPSGQEAGRFILLDPARQIRTEFSTEEILRRTATLHNWAAASPDPLLAFAANPQFKEEFDDRKGRLTLTHDAITYRVLTMESDKEASRQYKEFSDWYTRMGATLSPGGISPFPRLMVNTVLAKHQVIPREVQLAAPGFESRPELAYRSEHRVLFRLSKHDLDRIDQAQEYLAKFKKVDLDEYRQ